MPARPRYPRTRLTLNLLLVAVLAGIAVTEPAIVAPAVAAAITGSVVVWWPQARAGLPWAAGTAGLVSLGATAGRVTLDWPATPPWGLVEVALLCLLVGLLARWSPPRGAITAGVLAGASAALSLLRADAESSAELSALETVYAVAFWALGPITAAAAGLYVRLQADRRARAVEAARREQRLDLARDLHDYVAHDVSEMIAQAQAAQLITGEDGPAASALRRIETAGLKAMASMDRTVHMLHGDGGRTDPGGMPTEPAVLDVRPLPGIADLPELTGRFAAASTAEVRLNVEPGLAERVPRELAGTVHRIVTEALTNVRRHAPTATLVQVNVRRDGSHVEVSVVNDGSGVPAGELGRRNGLGGLGLPALTERVGILAGTLHAGPYDNAWHVVARLPLPGPPEEARR